jgi:hypothetical protein
MKDGRSSYTTRMMLAWNARRWIVRATFTTSPAFAGPTRKSRPQADQPAEAPGKRSAALVVRNEPESIVDAAAEYRNSDESLAVREATDLPLGHGRVSAAGAAAGR